MNHGWVVPNPDGSVARCGGPAICAECKEELGSKQRDARTAASDLWVELRYMGVDYNQVDVRPVVDVLEKAFKSYDMCDACAGTGVSTPKRPCMCQGTGRMSVAATYLRAKLFEIEKHTIDCEPDM